MQREGDQNLFSTIARRRRKGVQLLRITAYKGGRSFKGSNAFVCKGKETKIDYSQGRRCKKSRKLCARTKWMAPYFFQYSFVTSDLNGYEKTVFEELTIGLLEFVKPGADATITSSFLKVSYLREQRSIVYSPHNSM